MPACSTLTTRGLNPRPTNVAAPLAVGGRHESTVILQSEIWQPHGELLNLKPGKHEVQVMYDLIGSPYMDLRLLSNTVEVEILPADTKK
jgi:hypothetical protein